MFYFYLLISLAYLFSGGIDHRDSCMLGKCYNTGKNLISVIAACKDNSQCLNTYTSNFFFLVFLKVITVHVEIAQSHQWMEKLPK
jgi:hypothetical protein